MLDRMASSLINKLTGKYSPQIDRFRFRWKPSGRSSQYWMLSREKYLEITSFSPNGLSMYIGFPSGSLAVIWWLYTSVLSSADTKTQSTAAWLLISLLLPLTFRDYRFTQSIKPWCCSLFTFPIYPWELFYLKWSGQLHVKDMSRQVTLVWESHIQALRGCVPSLRSGWCTDLINVMKCFHLR